MADIDAMVCRILLCLSLLTAAVLPATPPNRMAQIGVPNCQMRWRWLRDFLRLDTLESRHRITLEEEFGHGANSKIYRGTATLPDGSTMPVIVKEAHSDTDLPHARELLAHEARVWEILQPGSTRFFEVCGRSYLVMPRTPRDAKKPEGGIAPTLNEALWSPEKRFAMLRQDPFRRDPVFVRKAALALVDGLAEMHRHSPAVAHGDIKPDNILLSLDENGDPVVHYIDLGIATIDGKAATNTIGMGSPSYYRPSARAHGDSELTRDVRALQRVLLELYLPHSLRPDNPAPGLTVARRWEKHLVRDPARILDSDPPLPPNLGLVFGSRVPRDTATLREMFREAEQPDFVKNFAERWQGAFQSATPSEQSDLIYEIVTARQLGPQVLRQLGPSLQKRIAEEVRFRRAWISNRGLAQSEWGWHHQTGDALKRFSELPEIKRYLAETPPQATGPDRR